MIQLRFFAKWVISTIFHDPWKGLLATKLSTTGANKDSERSVAGFINATGMRAVLTEQL